MGMCVSIMVVIHKIVSICDAQLNSVTLCVGLDGSAGL